MNRVYVILGLFDPADENLIRLQDSLRASGFLTTVIARRSSGDTNDKGVLILRDRALAIMAFGSQAVIAMIVLGYFSQFLPSVMTLVFWSLVFVAIIITSRYGKFFRDRIIDAISSALLSAILIQKKPAAVWVIAPFTMAQFEEKFSNRKIALVIDYESGENHSRRMGDAGPLQSGAPRRLQFADIIVRRLDRSYHLEARESPGRTKYALDTRSAAEKLAEILDQSAL